MAHVGLVQCGQEEALLAGQGEPPEMLLIDKRTHDNMRQMALGMLQSSEDGLLHARRTQEVTKSLVEAFDRPPAAKLVLPRLQNPAPSLSSSFVDQPPPPPPHPRPPQADTRRQPGQQSSGQQQQQQQPQQPLNSQSGPASCRPRAPPGGPRNSDDGGGDDGSSGIRRPWGSYSFYTAPTGTGKRNRTTTRGSGSSGTQGVQHQKEHQQEECQQEEEHHHDKDSNNEEDEIVEWTRDDWEWVEKQPGEDSDSTSSISEWDLADWEKLEGIIPGNTPTEKCGQCHTTATASPGDVNRTPTCQSTYSLSERDQSDCNSEAPQGKKTVTPHPLLNPPLQEGQEEPPSKDTSDEHDRRSNKSSPDQYQQHQRNFLPASFSTQPQWAQSQFTNFTHALRRITARVQPQQEATSLPPAGSSTGSSTGSEGEDTHPPGITPRGVATTQATQTTPEQDPTMEFGIASPETSDIPAVGPSEPADARGEWAALLESHPNSAAVEKGRGEVEGNKQKVVEEEYKKVYQELQRILSNACRSWLRTLGASEDSFRALQPKDEVSFGAYRSSFSPLISEDSAQEDNSIGRFLAALDRGQSLQEDIAAEMAAAGGQLSGGLLMEYVDVAREICQPHDDSNREIDELCSRAEIALGSGSSATAAATAESSN
ncbi:unnamed protein product [Tuber melanosporum]|uniref:(Perigord truffle) hypothetical protein n=1 Tax=Tuber melanosporum (strain Mel28) TaxID=656061 RepID=D5GGH3_TUBMM|nr:uncharacterized protein GSTUM_00007384001 [Tuber melanosporum]CAZ83616.1 unnamed protein product [Tuber melanosporum]